jgi:hypothetical protein
MHLILTLFLVTIGFFATAQNNSPRINTSGKSSQDFLPTGWKLIDSAQGDLNKDSLPDRVLIIENTDERNFVKNNGMGGDTLNANPRILLILFKDKNADTYRLIAQNNAFIPPPNDTVSPCLSDPIAETETITIKNCVLGLHFQYWLSCGSWFTSNHDYLFRYQNKQFELIGFNSMEFHRSSGEMSEYSINFSTKKLAHTEGGNMFEETATKPKTTWKKFTMLKLLSLESMDGDSFTEMLKIMDQK